LSSTAQLGYAKIALALLLRVIFSKITRAGFSFAPQSNPFSGMHHTERRQPENPMIQFLDRAPLSPYSTAYSE
jgi:hypothetical protein